jgi:hypothetical protein
MARHVGGIDAYGRDTPIHLSLVLDVLGFDDALWALYVADEVRWRHYALDCATHVLPIFEGRFPDDERVRACIEFYRAHPERPTEPAAVAAGAAWAAVAAGAAWAAWAAGAAEAAEAARAARAAEAVWQEERLRRYLGSRRPRPLPLPERAAS